MSNTAMNSEVPVAPAMDAIVEAPKQKKGGFRLLAILLLAACVGICFLNLTTFVSAWATKEQTLIDTFKALFDKANVNEKLFGLLPVLVAGKGMWVMTANLSLYAFVVALVVAAVLSLIAIFAGKRGLLATALTFMTFGGAIYALGVYAVTATQTSKAVFDVFALAFVGVCVFLSFVVKSTKLNNAVWLWLLHFVFALAVTVLLLMAATALKDFGDMKAKITLAIVAVLLLNAIVTYCRKKMCLVCAIFQLLLAIVATVCVYLILKKFNTDVILAAVAIGIALVQLLICLPKREKPVEAEIVEEYQKETYVEAYAYDGGPVAGVQLAEEVYPTVASIEAVKDPDGSARNTVASLLGNGFDPFLITLSTKEKEEFIDLYVLKCKGSMPEIPGYVVGGNNKEFFNCVFIYLGQYREKIPADLLEKMYKFSMKI